MQSECPAVEFVRVLGTVDVLTTERTVMAPATPLRRSLLALLAIGRGQAVASSQLLEDAWNGEPPRSGLRALRFHISRLRSEVPDGLVETVPDGYRLTAVSDIALAERSIDPAEALSLWRGRSLQDVQPSAALEEEQRYLEELRVGFFEQSFSAQCRANGHATSKAALLRLCEDYPVRESLWSVLVLDQYRNGNQAEALATIGTIRNRLRNDLGIDPGPELQHLEYRILNQDPELQSDTSHSQDDVPSLTVQTRSNTTDGDNNSGSREPAALPRIGTSFVGRSDELDKAIELLAANQLVTLVGSGGIGKTRLALAAAERASSKFTGGTWFCDLSVAVTRASAIHQLTETIGARSQLGGSSLDLVAERVADQDMLVVLDNCEHLGKVASELASALIGEESCQVLATSRMPIGASGEQVFPVGPLAEAADLFVRRASEADANFQATTANLEHIHSICASLDGVPLAIEMAAAHARTMALAEVRREVEDRFNFLKGSVRPPSTPGMAAERHGSLAATMQWSTNLLTAEANRLFHRLGVFPDSFDGEAASAICRPDNSLSTTRELLAELVDKSIIKIELEHRATRYRLTETARQYAMAQLDADVAASLAAGHAKYFADRAATLMPPSPTHEEWGSSTQWGQQFCRPEWQNIRAAVHWSAHNNEMQQATTLLKVAHHVTCWDLSLETCEWAGWLLEYPDAPLEAYGVVAFGLGISGDFESAMELVTEGLNRASWATTAETSWLWSPYAGALFRSGRLDDARVAVRKAFESSQLYGYDMDVYWAAAAAMYIGPSDLAESKGFAKHARSLLSLETFPHIAASTLLRLSRHEAEIGEPELALLDARRAEALVERYDLTWMRIIAAANRAYMAGMGLDGDAATEFANVVAVAAESQVWFDLLPLFEELALWWIDRGNLEEAATLIGHLSTRDRRTQWTSGERAADTIAAHALPQRSVAAGETYSNQEIVEFVLERLGASAD